jgi:hypothetical protein
VPLNGGRVSASVLHCKTQGKAPRAIVMFFHAIIPAHEGPIEYLRDAEVFPVATQAWRAMKRALVGAAICLLSIWFAACQPVRPAQHITATSLASRVDADDPAHTMCQSFALTAHDVSTFFRLATGVGGPEFHDRAVILPCRYDGTLMRDGETWGFSINAGGAGYLYKADGTQRRYLCEERCQKALARAFGTD